MYTEEDLEGMLDKGLFETVRKHAKDLISFSATHKLYVILARAYEESLFDCDKEKALKAYKQAIRYGGEGLYHTIAKLQNAVSQSKIDAQSSGLIGKFIKSREMKKVENAYSDVIAYEPSRQVFYDAMDALSGYPEKVIEIGELAIQQFPDEMFFYINVGRAHRALGNNEDAYAYTKESEKHGSPLFGMPRLRLV